MTIAAVVAIALVPLAGVLLLNLISDILSLMTHAPRRFVTGSQKAGLPVRARLLVLVPAHDEAMLIERCVRSLLSMEIRRSSCDVFVLADNCSDSTAEIAAAAGASVLSRDNPAQRGKPRAIEWALSKLPVGDYDAVAIVDADTVVDARFADALAEHAPLRDVALQSYFGLSNEGDSWLSLLGGLMARMRYEGQYILKAASGLNCPLTGNGMCLGTALLARGGWAPDSLTENWELYARYTAAGERIVLAANARIYSQEAHTLELSATQRRRWQAGRWIVLRDHWRSLLTSKRINWHQRIDALAELSSPGPVLGATLALASAVLLLWLGGTFAETVAAAFLLSLTPTVVWTLLALERHPRRVELLLAFFRLPVYMFWRVGVAALAISTGARGAWHRSPRHT